MIIHIAVNLARIHALLLENHNQRIFQNVSNCMRNAFQLELKMPKDSVFLLLWANLVLVWILMLVIPKLCKSLMFQMSILLVGPTGNSSPIRTLLLLLGLRMMDFTTMTVLLLLKRWNHFQELTCKQHKELSNRWTLHQSQITQRMLVTLKLKLFMMLQSHNQPLFMLSSVVAPRLIVMLGMNLEIQMLKLQLLMVLQYLLPRLGYLLTLWVF